MYERQTVRYMKDALHRRQCRMTRRIVEKGRNKMDLEFESAMVIIEPTA